MSKPKKWDTMTQEERDEWIQRQAVYQARYRAKHQERVRESKRRSFNKAYSKNPEKFKKLSRDKLERHLELSKLRYWENPEKHRESAREWAKKNPEKITDMSLRRASEMKPSYIAHLLEIPTETLKKHPDLITAKREQIKILRQLRQNKKENNNAQESK